MFAGHDHLYLNQLIYFFFSLVLVQSGVFLRAIVATGRTGRFAVLDGNGPLNGLYNACDTRKYRNMQTRLRLLNWIGCNAFSPFPVTIPILLALLVLGWGYVEYIQPRTTTVEISA